MVPSGIILPMASLFQKLRTLVRATLHEMADQAIQKSDLAIYDEYIRRAERELNEFKQTIGPMIAQVKTTKRRRENLANKAAELDFLVDEYLRQDKQTEAMVTQKQLLAAAEMLDDVRVKLEGRLAIAKQEREELAFLLQLAKAKEVSAKAMRSLDSLMDHGDIEVSRAAENIRKRLDHADAAWEIQASSLDNQLDDAMHSLEVEAELAARMERLGL
jgi:phage shock protein A